MDWSMLHSFLSADQRIWRGDCYEVEEELWHTTSSWRKLEGYSSKVCQIFQADNSPKVRRTSECAYCVSLECSSLYYCPSSEVFRQNNFINLETRCSMPPVSEGKVDEVKRLVHRDQIPAPSGPTVLFLCGCAKPSSQLVLRCSSFASRQMPKAIQPLLDRNAASLRPPHASATYGLNETLSARLETSGFTRTFDSTFHRWSGSLQPGSDQKQMWPFPS